MVWSKAARMQACERYSRFLLQSYLRWQRLRDLRNVSCIVRFHQPTVVEGRAFYPTEFLDLLKLQLLLDLEVRYQCTASGWKPGVEVEMLPEGAAMSLSIWFERLGQPQVQVAAGG